MKYYLMPIYSLLQITRLLYHPAFYEMS